MATKTKRSGPEVTAKGRAYIKATFNNLIISLTNQAGQVIAHSSAGKMGFRGAKKNTPYAAQATAENCATPAVDGGMRSIDVVYVQGAGSGREAAIRALHGAGLKVHRIEDVTPIPHNGCRPPKRRKP